MLNEVRIFEASVFNSKLYLKFINLKLDSRNLSHGDNQSVSFTVNFTARSYDLAHPGAALPLVGGMSAVSFHLSSAADMSIALLITQ